MTEGNNNTVSLKEYTDLRINDTILASNQRFEAQQLALKDALISQEKAVAAALEGTKEAIVKNDANTDKRFDLLSEKIGGVVEAINKNTGAERVYVTHSDLSSALDKLQTSIQATLLPVVTFMNTQVGKAKGADDIWIKVVAILGLVATAITLLIKFIPSQ